MRTKVFGAVPFVNKNNVTVKSLIRCPLRVRKAIIKGTG